MNSATEKLLREIRSESLFRLRDLEAMTAWWEHEAEKGARCCEVDRLSTKKVLADHLESIAVTKVRIQQLDAAILAEEGFSE